MSPDNKRLPNPPPPAPKGIPGADGHETAQRTRGGITCAKCSHVNKAGSSRCETCESHLHIKCNDCGARNERVYSRCQTCGRRLHKTMLEKMNKRVFQHGGKLTVGQLVLAIAAAILIFGAIVALNTMRMPKIF